MKTAIATLCAVAAAVAMAIILAIGFGGLHRWIAAVALVSGAATGVACAAGTTDYGAGQKPSTAAWTLLAVFALAAMRSFFWLLYPDGNEFRILSPYNLGDIALHIDLIRYLASGIPFWPESPILSNDTLRYPICADLLNALLLNLGVGLIPGLIWTGLVASALAAFLLWRWGGAFALAAFLFNGGFEAIPLIVDWFRTGTIETRDLLASAQWKSLFLTLFVTQRGLLFGLPAGLVLLNAWRSQWCGRKGVSMPFPAQLLLYAAMPLFNVHAFLFLSVVLGTVFALGGKPGARTGALRLVLAALVPASASVWLVSGGFGGAAGGIHWLPGWLQDSASPLGFWMWNFGLMLPLWAILLILLLFGKQFDADRCFPVAATITFVACMLVSFAPWPWDNTKLMLWAWLAVAPSVGSLVVAPLPLPLRTALCVTLFCTGAISLSAGLDRRHGYRLAQRDYLDAVAHAVSPIAPTARFASAPAHDHPLLLLGRKVATGYEGHLWSHGLDYSPVMDALKLLMNGGPGWRQAAQFLQVRYLFWGSHEQQAFPASTKPWAQQDALLTQDAEFAIYDLEKTR